MSKLVIKIIDPIVYTTKIYIHIWVQCTHAVYKLKPLWFGLSEMVRASSGYTKYPAVFS